MFSNGCQALPNILLFNNGFEASPDILIFNKTKNNKQKRTYIVTEQRYVRKGDGGDE